MAESRSIDVPEGLGGERLDVVLSRLFGFSRAFAQEIIDSGGALLAVTASLARWKTLESLPPRICPMDGKTLSAGGAHD